MEEIKRYDIELEGDPDNGHSMFQDEVICNDGEWVKYTDHKAVVETMEKQVKEVYKDNTELFAKNKELQNKTEELEKYNLKLRCCENCINKDNKITPNTMCYLRTCYECEDFSNWIAKGINR